VVALRLNPARQPLERAEQRHRLLAALRLDALIDVVLAGRVERAPGLLRLHAKSPPVTGEGARPSGSAAAPAGALLLVYPEAESLRTAAERIRVDLHAAGLAVTPRGLASLAYAEALERGAWDLALVVLPGDGLPPVVAMGEVTAFVGAEPSAPLMAAAARAGGEGGGELFAAEAALLEGAELRPIFRRARRLVARERLRDARVGPDGVAVLEDAWRWERP